MRWPGYDGDSWRASDRLSICRNRMVPNVKVGIDATMVMGHGTTFARDLVNRYLDMRDKRIACRRKGGDPPKDDGTSCSPWEVFGANNLSRIQSAQVSGALVQNDRRVRSCVVIEPWMPRRGSAVLKSHRYAARTMAEMGVDQNLP